MTYNPVQKNEYEQQSSSSSSSHHSSGWQRNFRDPFATDPEKASYLPPEVAPLVYYSDEEREGSPEEKEEKPKTVGDKVKGTWSRFNSYLDRRAQAQYVSEQILATRLVGAILSVSTNLATGG